MKRTILTIAAIVTTFDIADQATALLIRPTPGHPGVRASPVLPK